MWIASRDQRRAAIRHRCVYPAGNKKKKKKLPFVLQASRRRESGYEPPLKLQEEEEHINTSVVFVQSLASNW